MGQLVLDNMEFFAHHGHFDEEQVIGGRFKLTWLLILISQGHRRQMILLMLLITAGFTKQ